MALRLIQLFILHEVHVMLSLSSLMHFPAVFILVIQEVYVRSFQL